MLTFYSYLLFFCVVAIIGFDQTAYTFDEGDGTVEVCAVFLQPRDPSRIAPNVVVELMGSTSPDTADGMEGKLFSLYPLVFYVHSSNKCSTYIPSNYLAYTLLCQIVICFYSYICNLQTKGL